MEDSFHFMHKNEDSEALFKLINGQYNKKSIFTLSIMLTALLKEWNSSSFNSTQVGLLQSAV